MIAEASTFANQHIVQILTAITLILFGGWLFEARDGFFLSLGRFRGKLAGLLLLIVAIVAVSATTPFIDQFWQSLVVRYETSRIAGLVLIAGMFAVNKSAEWNYFDRKSVIVYAVGALIVLQPGPLNGLL